MLQLPTRNTSEAKAVAAELIKRQKKLNNVFVFMWWVWAAEIYQTGNTVNW